MDPKCDAIDLNFKVYYCEEWFKKGEEESTDLTPIPPLEANDDDKLFLWYG